VTVLAVPGLPPVAPDVVRVTAEPPAPGVKVYVSPAATMISGSKATSPLPPPVARLVVASAAAPPLPPPATPKNDSLPATGNVIDWASVITRSITAGLPPPPKN
jgi:hypothetical protein